MYVRESSYDFTYDAEADVLYVWAVGKRRPTLGRPHPLKDSIILRYAIDDGELVGATVLDFSNTPTSVLREMVHILFDWDSVQP